MTWAFPGRKITISTTAARAEGTSEGPRFRVRVRGKRSLGERQIACGGSDAGHSPLTALRVAPGFAPGVRHKEPAGAVGDRARAVGR